MDSTHRSIESVHYNRWDVEFSLSNLLKLLDSNRQPVYYYNEHGQVEIVVITLKEFFKLTFLSFGIPNANRWDVEFSLSNLLKLLDSNRQPVSYYNEHGQVEIVVITLKEFFKLTFLSFGIPNANRWDVEFSLSNLLKLLDSNRQPVYYYNEHGQVEIVVITLKEFFKLTFLSFGIPNANRWDVEFSLSNLLKLLDSNRQPVYYYNEHGQVEIVVITLKEFFKLTFLRDFHFFKVLQNACHKCLRFPLFHHKHAQSAPKRLPEWNKTKFETMPQISTFSSQTCSKCLETLARVK